jgi:hypothetical protein
MNNEQSMDRKSVVSPLASNVFFQQQQPQKRNLKLVTFFFLLTPLQGYGHPPFPNNRALPCPDAVAPLAQGKAERIIESGTWEMGRGGLINGKIDMKELNLYCRNEGNGTSWQ